MLAHARESGEPSLTLLLDVDPPARTSDPFTSATPEVLEQTVLVANLSDQLEKDPVADLKRGPREILGRLSCSPAGAERIPRIPLRN